MGRITMLHRADVKVTEIIRRKCPSKELHTYSRCSIKVNPSEWHIGGASYKILA